MATKAAAKRAAPADKKVVEVVSFKQWLIIRDLEAYTALLQIGLPFTKLHEDVLAIIKPLLNKAGIRFKPKPWITEFEELVAEVGERLKNPAAVKVEAHRMWVQLPTEKSCDNLQARLEDWLARRSFTCTFARRENKGRWTLRAEVLFDRNINYAFIETDEESPSATLQLDDVHDLKIYFGKKPQHFHLRLNAKTGDEDVALYARDLPFSKLHRDGLLEFAAMLLKAAQQVDTL